MTEDLSMMWAEVDDIGGLLHEIDDSAFDAPSLCDGWAVRDVLGHMSVGHTTPFPSMVVRVARRGFNVTKASFEESQTFAEDRSADELRQFWDQVMIAERPRKGISKMIPDDAGFLDHLIHHQDIRRPLGRPRDIPPPRLHRALELVSSVGNPIFNPKKTVAGLKLTATDIEWSAGDGPAVEGPGEAIVLVAAGRRVALDDLSGDGVAVLRERLAS
jgi:uncharacterized protein (TIGR03083 family)